MGEAVNIHDRTAISNTMDDYRIVVLVPCFNEEATIAKVVDDFRAALPAAEIYVFDNNSTDRTIELARRHGAIVRHENRQGKGHVVRRMFASVDADIYVLVDGDDTYNAAYAPNLIQALIDSSLDMVNASRQSDERAAYRPGHRFGNWLLTSMVRTIFENSISDMLSGYRVFSRRFVKSFPVRSRGFEIETEITVHALELNMPIIEYPVPYKERPVGSSSKLNTFRDGFRILRTIFNLVRDERPLMFFSLIGTVLAVAAVILAIPIVDQFLEEGIVPRLPTAVLSMGLVLLAFLSLACGLILDTVSRGRRELKYLNYLRIPGLHGGEDRRDESE